VHNRRQSVSETIRHRGSLLKLGKQIGLIGPTDSDRRDPLGNAMVTVDFTNMSKGVRTKATADGLFKTVKLNRGRSMPMASQDD
jgi:hypothetical protein